MLLDRRTLLRSSAHETTGVDYEAMSYEKVFLMETRYGHHEATWCNL